MSDAALAGAEAEVRAAAEAYARALHAGDGAALEALCHERFTMHWVEADGAARMLDRTAFVARVAAREALPGAPDLQIHAVDLAGPEIAHVKLSVAAPPRRFIDYLGFFRTEARWRLVTKLFRVAEGPAMTA